jgi:hypothetical protein
MPALEARNIGVSIWTDANEEKPPVLTTVVVATLCEHTNDGWCNLGHLTYDGKWQIDDAVEGDSIDLPSGFKIVAWQMAPRWPQHIHKTAEHIDTDEPILLKDGTVLDPVTREVVNHLP